MQGRQTGYEMAEAVEAETAFSGKAGSDARSSSSSSSCPASVSSQIVRRLRIDPFHAAGPEH
jgi:hypothetical protein